MELLSGEWSDGAILLAVLAGIGILWLLIDGEW